MGNRSRKRWVAVLGMTAAMFSLSADARATLFVTQELGSNVNVPGDDVYLFRAKDTSGTTSVNAFTIDMQIDGSTGQFLYADDGSGTGNKDGYGGLYLSSIYRTKPLGTYAALPNAANVIYTPDTQSDFNNGSREFQASSFSITTPYTTTASSGLIIAAAVVTHGAQFSYRGTIEGADGNDIKFSSFLDVADITFSSSSVTLDPTVNSSFGPVTLEGSLDGDPFPITFGPVDPRIASKILFGGTPTSPTISGSGFTLADAGTYQINATVAFDTEPFTITVLPEPTTALALLGLAAAATTRPRRVESSRA